jgi:hypothetical protein
MPETLTQESGQLAEAPEFVDAIGDNRQPERKSLLKRILAALAPQLFADEKIVYQTQTRRPKA